MGTVDILNKSRGQIGIGSGRSIPRGKTLVGFPEELVDEGMRLLVKGNFIEIRKSDSNGNSGIGILLPRTDPPGPSMPDPKQKKKRGRPRKNPPTAQDAEEVDRPTTDKPETITTDSSEINISTAPPPPKPSVPATDTADGVPTESWRKDQLLGYCRTRGIKFKGTKTKSNILAAIREHEGG